MIRAQCSMAAAAISFASRIRSISCAVLTRARLREERRRVLAGVPKASNQLVRERRRLADHAVGRLRAERELEPDALVLGAPPARARSSARAVGGRGSVSS